MTVTVYLGRLEAAFDSFYVDFFELSGHSVNSNATCTTPQMFFFDPLQKLLDFLYRTITEKQPRNLTNTTVVFIPWKFHIDATANGIPIPNQNVPYFTRNPKIFFLKLFLLIFIYACKS